MKNKKKCDLLSEIAGPLAQMQFKHPIGYEMKKNKKIEIFGTVNSSYEKIPLLHYVIHAKSISYLTLIFLDFKGIVYIL